KVDLICGLATAVLWETVKNSSRSGDEGPARKFSRAGDSCRLPQLVKCALIRNSCHSLRKSCVYRDDQSVVPAVEPSDLAATSPSTHGSPFAYLSGCFNASCMAAK